MPHDVIMPALGMAQDTGLLVAWHKNPGDPVDSGDVLFEVETDKSTMEVEAQANGFLSNVKHGAGSNVPVGQVIAQITDAPENAIDHAKDAPVASSEPSELPKGHNIIMPALGMAQDKGLIVAWHKSLGDAVAAQDILFEVETDKSTMEVEAGQDGYLAALLYPAGAEAPVGVGIAIITVEKPETTFSMDRSGSTAPKFSVETTPTQQDTPSLEKPAAPIKTGITSQNGKVLASPKARRMALQLGLDFNDLVAAGHPQPYHAADIEFLRKLPKSRAAQSMSAVSAQLKAKVNPAALFEFTQWSGTFEDATLIAGFAGAALAQDSANITIATPVSEQHFNVDTSGTITVTEAPYAIDLLIFDLRNTPVQTAQVGSKDVPTMTLIQKSAKKLVINLEYRVDQLTSQQAIAVITEFSQTLEQPLRRLL